ncbi:MAG: hypothetical protein HQL56_07060 [Magnetococcales bacterium]|nr:hypothetical protein [Magnetococcales bacterium]
MTLKSIEQKKSLVTLQASQAYQSRQGVKTPGRTQGMPLEGPTASEAVKVSFSKAATRMVNSAVQVEQSASRESRSGRTQVEARAVAAASHPSGAHRVAIDTFA